MNIWVDSLKMPFRGEVIFITASLLTGRPNGISKLVFYIYR